MTAKTDVLGLGFEKGWARSITQTIMLLSSTELKQSNAVTVGTRKGKVPQHSLAYLQPLSESPGLSGLSLLMLPVFRRPEEITLVRSTLCRNNCLVG